MTNFQDSHAPKGKPGFFWYVLDRYGKRHEGFYRAKNRRTLIRRLKREYPKLDTVGYYL